MGAAAVVLLMGAVVVVLLKGPVMVLMGAVGLVVVVLLKGPVMVLMGAAGFAVLAGDFSPYSARHSSSASEEYGRMFESLTVIGITM